MQYFLPIALVLSSSDTLDYGWSTDVMYSAGLKTLHCTWERQDVQPQTERSKRRLCRTGCKDAGNLQQRGVRQVSLLITKRLDSMSS